MNMQIESILKNGYHEKDGIYVPAYVEDGTVWDTLATTDLLDAATSAVSEEHATKKGEPQILQLEHEAKGDVLLDLGCGYGRIAEQLLPRRPFEAYIGIDSSLKMLRFARERKHGRADITTPMYFVYGKIDAIPLVDASVDTVVVSAVFLHNHKSVTQKSLMEIYRILKPGGKLFVFGSFPNLVSLMGVQVALYLFFLKIFGDPYRNGPVRYFSKREVKKLLTSYTHAEIVPSGFGVFPKRILLFPKSVNMLYLRFVANPINTLCATIIPRAYQDSFATHHDVIAIK